MSVRWNYFIFGGIHGNELFRTHRILNLPPSSNFFFRLPFAITFHTLMTSIVRTSKHNKYQ
jgi:hypothetical protein